MGESRFYQALNRQKHEAHFRKKISGTNTHHFFLDGTHFKSPHASDGLKKENQKIKKEIIAWFSGLKLDDPIV